MGGPNNKEYSIFGVYIGVPLFRETTKKAGKQVREQPQQPPHFTHSSAYPAHSSYACASHRTVPWTEAPSVSIGICFGFVGWLY